MWMTLTGSAETLPRFALALVEHGFRLWSMPVFPDGSARVVVACTPGEISWLRYTAARAEIKTRRSYSNPSPLLTRWCVSQLAIPAERARAPFTLHVKQPKANSWFRCFDDNGLSLTSALLRANILPLVYLTKGAALVYVQGSLTLKRALIRRGFACATVFDLPREMPARRLSLILPNRRIASFIVPEDATSYDFHAPLRSTLSDHHFSEEIRHETVDYLGQNLIVWTPQFQKDALRAQSRGEAGPGQDHESQAKAGAQSA